LTGLLACHRCGRILTVSGGRRGSPGDYRCKVDHTGCGGTFISRPKIDGHVRATVAGWLRDPDLVAAIDAWFAGYDDSDVAAELAEIDERMTKARQLWTAGDLDDEHFEAALADLRARRGTVEERRTRTPRRPAPVTADTLAGDLTDATVAEWRAIVAAMAHTPIAVGPGRGPHGTALPVEQRVNLRPIWEG
jgi:hypothetical protein